MYAIEENKDNHGNKNINLLVLLQKNKKFEKQIHSDPSQPRINTSYYNIKNVFKMKNLRNKLKKKQERVAISIGNAEYKQKY